MKHRVAVLGLGIMGRRMLAALTRHPDFEIAAAWDLRPEAGDRARNEFPGIRIAPGAQAAVESAELVYIATPPSNHAEYARLAIRARKPVLCEKPLTADLQEGRRLVEEARGVPNAVNFPFASNPSVRTLERKLREKAHGTARLVEIRLHFNEWPRAWQRDAAGWLAKRTEGGFLREVFSHFAYLTRRLVGPIAIRSKQVTFPEDGVSSETYVAAELDCGGVPVKLAGGVGGAAPDYNEWTLYGTERSFRMRDWSQLQQADRERWSDLAPDQPPLPQLQDQLNSLSRMLKGQPHELPDFAAGLEVQRVVEALLS